MFLHPVDQRKELLHINGLDRLVRRNAHVRPVGGPKDHMARAVVVPIDFHGLSDPLEVLKPLIPTRVGPHAGQDLFDTSH